MATESLFYKEEDVIRAGEMFLCDNFGKDGLADSDSEAYITLLKNYSHLLAQTKRLVRLADSQQETLKRLTGMLNDKTNMLTATLGSLEQEIERRKKLEKELQHLASVDLLTGTLSRRAIIEQGELEIKRMERSGIGLVVLMLDIDHFKAINDTYGHSAGDEVLRIFAGVCQHSLRETDQFGRLGGEEFVAIMPGASPAEALVVAQRICNKVGETEISYGATTLKLTVSIGLAEACGDNKSFDAVLAQADKALYTAKNNGRNRVVMHAASGLV
jgi:diguanylate cyclase (GGDEF)-like protein